MRRSRRWISYAILATLCLTFALGATASPTGAQNEPTETYIALGDSLAVGLGASLPRKHGYVAILHDWFESGSGTAISLANLARPGETVDSFLTGGQLDALQQQVDQARQSGVPIHAVSLSLGGNAVLNVQQAGLSDRQAALDQFSASYPDVLQQIRQIIGDDVPFVVTTIYDPTGGNAAVQKTDSWWIEQFNAVIRDAASQSQAAVADIAQTFEGQADELTYYPLDVHPTNAGHRVIAKTVFSALDLDTMPPDIQIDAPATAQRLTPTVYFTLQDEPEVDSFDVQLSDGSHSPIIPLDAGQHVMLLDLADVDGDSVTITIEATDVAGNQATAESTVALPD